MGKYMRKRSVGRTPAVEFGVRTRARTAAVASAAAAEAEAPAPKRPRKQATARAVDEAAVSANGGGAAPAGCCCYLQLRSRRLFMPAGEVHCPAVPPSTPAAAVQRSAGASVEPVDAGISRSSSTASSVDVGVLAVAPARERSGGEAEAREDCECDVESVVSDSTECRRRDRRETTPSSRPPAVDLSDEEWSQATDDDAKRHRRMALATATPTTVVACRSARMPPAGEIDEFFRAAEKAQAERFAAKYNFDVARGVPLGAGRYEWTPVASQRWTTT